MSPNSQAPALTRPLLRRVHAVARVGRVQIASRSGKGVGHCALTLRHRVSEAACTRHRSNLRGCAADSWANGRSKVSELVASTLKAVQAAVERRGGVFDWGKAGASDGGGEMVYL